MLYEFVVSVQKSTCSPDAGNGAFLFYNGAQVLKKDREWKIKKYPKNVPKTRNPLEALLSDSGVSVTLAGANIHGDEHRYGPERDGSVGAYNEFTLDDFVDSEDNVTFSSKHLGCALIELESRYAPLLPTDRKSDFIFAYKDFAFSNEPSSWRYDIKEEFKGYVSK